MKIKYIKFTWLQTIAWLVIFFLPYLNIIFEPERLNNFNYVFFLIPFLFTVTLFFLFYFNLFVLAPSFIIDKNIVYFIVVALGLVLFLYVNHFIYSKLSALANVSDTATAKSATDKRWEVFPRYIFPSIFYILTLLVSNIHFLLNERRNENEEKQKMQIEKIATELSMLKLQISPHFLFNTLNNIRWMVRKQMGHTEEVVMKLSEILRYIIYEVGEAKVAIQQEVEHLKNYIELQSLRLPVPGVVAFNVSSSIGSQKIEPLLFIHFVENAFKYGIDSKTAPEIVFELDNIGNQLIFKAKNKILNPTNKLENTGIGLSNIKRRLELLYANKHSLETRAEDGYYLVKLILILDEN
ncbi:sensor histidine kinase [Lacihabitans sp. CCS-44]|uniref:sensor histidine kinase n=1 Tax=Lacihabitans sp. CCS-44 TaxID=2487331 RepID=UPI0020CB8F9E|nr:histidine kinase [Lacihabitans sp. CCS-44]